MPSVWPPRVPDLLNPGVDFLLKNPIDTPEWQAVCEHLQAIFNYLGVNPQSDKGTVANRIASLSTMLTGLGTTGYRNLRISNYGGSANTQLIVTADALAIEGVVASAITVTVDIAANTGKNGITFTRAPNVWGYLWMGVHATTLEVGGIFDASADRTALNLAYANLDGFRNWRLAGVYRLDGTGSGNLKRVSQFNDVVLYSDTQYAIAGGGGAAAGIPQTTSISTLVPPISRYAYVDCSLYLPSVGVDLALIPPNAVAGHNVVQVTANTIEHSAVWTDSGVLREIKWSVSANGGANCVFFDVLGYRVPL